MARGRFTFWFAFKRVKIVRNYLRKKGYDSNFIFKATFNDAISSLEKNDRIDFFYLRF